MKHFRQLTRSEIRTIYVGYLTATPKLTIAKELQVDNSTVHYHINKVKHLTVREIISLIGPACARCEAPHPSVKCLVCGGVSDNIRSEEFQMIRALREQVRTLEIKLSDYEKGSSTSDTNPVTAVLG